VYKLGLNGSPTARDIQLLLAEISPLHSLNFLTFVDVVTPEFYVLAEGLLWDCVEGALIDLLGGNARESFDVSHDLYLLNGYRLGLASFLR